MTEQPDKVVWTSNCHAVIKEGVETSGPQVTGSIETSEDQLEFWKITNVTTEAIPIDQRDPPVSWSYPNHEV